MIAYGLLGEKLGHSYSKPIHNMLASYDYELYPVSRERLHALMRGRAFQGLNVTIPYKLEVMPYCDALSEEARAVGSVNTLTFDESGRLWGHNTDLFGFEDLARRADISLANKKVLILGSGGASRTAQAAARRAGASEIIVASRQGPVDYACLRTRHADGQVIINTTPVGMYPENGVSPVQLSDFPKCEGVLDMIYNPLRTELLMQAEERNIPNANGLWMLIAQAWRAAELFQGAPIPLERALEVKETMLSGLTQLVLVGMPGCGKSSLGRRMAESMGRRFVDMDEWIEAQAGLPVPRIIREQGEAAFRALEHEAARALGKENGLVIATGGGVVLDLRNIRALRQNGRIVFVERTLDQLDMRDRPLSKSRAALERMARERLPLYRGACDISLENNCGLEDCAKALEEKWNDIVGDQWA